MISSRVQSLPLSYFCSRSRTFYIYVRFCFFSTVPPPSRYCPLPPAAAPVFGSLVFISQGSSRTWGYIRWIYASNYSPPEYISHKVFFIYISSLLSNLQFRSFHFFLRVCFLKYVCSDICLVLDMCAHLKDIIFLCFFFFIHAVL